MTNKTISAGLKEATAKSHIDQESYSIGMHRFVWVILVKLNSNFRSPYIHDLRTASFSTESANKKLLTQDPPSIYAVIEFGPALKRNLRRGRGKNGLCLRVGCLEIQNPDPVQDAEACLSVRSQATFISIAWAL